MTFVSTLALRQQVPSLRWLQVFLVRRLDATPDHFAQVSNLMASKTVLHYREGQIKEEQLNWFSRGLTARTHIHQAAATGLALDMAVDGLVDTGLCMMETKGVDLSASVDRKVAKVCLRESIHRVVGEGVKVDDFVDLGGDMTAVSGHQQTMFTNTDKQGRGSLPKINVGNGAEATIHAQDITEATQLDASGSSMSTAGISWASPLVSPSLLPTTASGDVQVSRGFHVGVEAVANAGSQTAWSCGPLHFGQALMLAAGLHGQIWTIVPDKSRSKFLQAVPKPPHIGSDGALPLLYTGGLWAKLPNEVKADLGVLHIHVPPGYMLIINKASPLVTQSSIMCMHAHKSHIHAHKSHVHATLYTKVLHHRHWSSNKLLG